jgi:Fe-S-cluster-containing dehydrogenase component
MKAVLIDVEKCNGCYNCQLACKDEHVDNDWSPYARPQPDMGHLWMNVANVERGKFPKVKVAYVPKLCMQCGDAPCMKAAGEGAVYRREDGIVIIDPVKSQGQKQIVDSCPHGTIFWNKELEIPQKCTFCAHLLDAGWKQPRCVESCPTGALVFGEYEEIMAGARGKNLEIMNPEYGLRPNVFYVGLPKRFVAGTVLFGDKNDCAENVAVALTGGGTELKTRTNNYGDFEFEGLAPDQKFSVKIQFPGYGARVFDVQTKENIYLGEIVLTE